MDREAFRAQAALEYSKLVLAEFLKRNEWTEGFAELATYMGARTADHLDQQLYEAEDERGLVGAE